MVPLHYRSLYMMQCSTVQCCAVQCSAVQSSVVQCSAVQFSAGQYNIVQSNLGNFFIRNCGNKSQLNMKCNFGQRMRTNYCITKELLILQINR